jgi:predicted enzyme related to lactoylglutathione lyase
MKAPIKPNHHVKTTKTAGLTVQFHRLTLPVTLILTLYLLSGCGTFSQSVYLPPVTETSPGPVKEGNFVWIDLVTEDVEAAASFYSRLFGWRATKSDVNREYFLFYLDDKPVAGMVAMENKDAAAPESLWLATMSVSDVDKSLVSVKTHGGKVLEGPLDAAGRGRMVLVSDSADAPFILLGASGDSPVGRKAKIGQWHWIDLITQDGNRSRAFYTAMFGYQVKPVEADEEHQYDIFIQDQRAVAGIVELQWEGLEDNWLPYFKVADIDRSIENARSLGGKLILQSGKVAVLVDPTGAVFGIQARYHKEKQNG